MRYLVLVFIYFLTINVGNSQYSVAIDRQRDAQCFPWAAGYNVTYKAYITLNPNSEEICEDIYIKVGSGITSEIVGPLIFVNSNRNSNPNGADCIGTLMEVLLM